MKYIDSLFFMFYLTQFYFNSTALKFFLDERQSHITIIKNANFQLKKIV